MVLRDYALTTFVTLLVVVDPVGLAPVFLSITQGLSKSARRDTGWLAAAIGAAILIATALGGTWLLDQLGIGLAAFRISGGILLFAVAFEMVLGVRPAREARQAEQAAEEHARNIAAFPLAIPLIAGPGAITATLLLAGRSAGDPLQLIALIAIIVAVAIICGITFALAGRLAGALGNTGNMVLSRLLGVVLAALAVQFVIDGCREAFG
jgi:multiple antibiotic resistance protein